MAASPVDLSTVTPAIAADYHYAADHLADLAQIPCYCGCDHSLGHRNLADCYMTAIGEWDAHASGSAVCGNETGIGTLTALAAITVFAFTSGGSSADTAATPTGETNSMGMPIIATPGAGSGVAEVDGVTATPSVWALGRVALNVAVQPNWTFENTGTRAVTLGTPHVEIKEGCCPGALTYTGPTTLQPDQSTELTFELSMHPGMDGAHDMTLHVPMQYADGTTSVLDLAVTGDFRD